MLKKELEKKRELNRKRSRRVRARIAGSAQKPRMCVCRSLKHIAVQLIDDVSGRTLIAVDDGKVKPAKTENRSAKAALAYAVGLEVAI